MPTARRNQHRSTLAAAADELEEQMGCIGLAWQVAAFVDDQQLGPGTDRQLLVEPAIVVGFGQGRYRFAAVTSRTL